MSANPDGQYMPRAERHRQVVAMKRRGMTFSQIAAALGISKSTVTSAYYDPTGDKERGRKAVYYGECDQCGGPTSYKTGGFASRCRSCIEWTPEAVLLAFHEWVDSHGGVPPTVKNSHVAAELPHERTVSRLFGSWNNARLAAGFELVCDRRPETMAMILQRLRAGDRVVEIADSLGVTREAIHQRLRVRGLSLADARAGKVTA